MTGSSVAPTLRRRFTLGAARALHSALRPISGLATRGLPRVYGVPVLGAGNDWERLHGRLEEALALIQRVQPSRLKRFSRSLSGVFITGSRRLHGHYGRITGTCTLDRGLLATLPIEELAEHLVYCATEAALWRGGVGKTGLEEDRLHIAAARAAELFCDRLASMPPAPSPSGPEHWQPPANRL